ncbi:hypothetical protein [Actinosynnema sp. ALI-1.44]|uniref:hypothetical protein n=1 Tax=Actinosynnema sp. ALI-1.44 TaxID=1933779 RepID=UPI00187577AE|nr:hypothetical protein [Actinosynnema sp. ALI-1.44]
MRRYAQSTLTIVPPAGVTVHNPDLHIATLNGKGSAWRWVSSSGLRSPSTGAAWWIASYPGVHSLGEVPGGQGLSLPEGGGRLVVDPATGRVNRTSVHVSMDGARNKVADAAGA